MIKSASRFLGPIFLWVNCGLGGARECRVICKIRNKMLYLLELLTQSNYEEDIEIEC